MFGINYSTDPNYPNLSGAKSLSLPIACPEEGSFIGFKKCQNDMIVKLEIPKDALRCSATGRECRCSKAKVLSITNRWNECSTGIHFFITR